MKKLTGPLPHSEIRETVFELFLIDDQTIAPVHKKKRGLQQAHHGAPVTIGLADLVQNDGTYATSQPQPTTGETSICV